MKGINKTVLASMAMVVLALAGCSQKNVSESTEASQVETTTARVEVTSEEAEESTESASEADIVAKYVLTDDAKKELECVFKNCLYFGIGKDKEQIFSELSRYDVETLLCTTYITPDSYLKRGVYKEGTGYVVSREELSEYLKGGFGLELDSFDFSTDDYMLYEDGDTFYFLGGDYGMAYPDAFIDTIEQDPDSGIITLTGDVLFISEEDTEGVINPYIFTATMQPSDSKYFGGNTLISFEYEANTTGVYPDIDASKYGLDSIRFEVD